MAGSRVLSVVGFALAAVAQGATLWTELPPGAGSLPASAQAVPADTVMIFGNLLDGRGGQPANPVDLFRLTVPSARRLAAETLGGFGLIDDPQLFLFDAAGLGLLWNNDRSATPSNTQARLLLDLLPGTYYLAISFFAVDPMSVGGFIFDTLNSPLGSGAIGPGAGSAVSAWDNTLPSSIWDTTGYAISFGAVPEPSTWALVCAGAALIAAVRRRRQIAP